MGSRGHDSWARVTHHQQLDQSGGSFCLSFLCKGEHASSCQFIRESAEHIVRGRKKKPNNVQGGWGGGASFISFSFSFLLIFSPSSWPTRSWHTGREQERIPIVLAGTQPPRAQNYLFPRVHSPRAQAAEPREAAKERLNCLLPHQCWPLLSQGAT